MDWPYLDTEVPFGFAHQGGNEVAPGNTDAAFDHAVSLGYRYIETDVQVTSDGVLVLFHDDELADLTGEQGRVEDKTIDELRELRVRGEHPIPLFEEVLARLPSIRFNLDPKSDATVEPLVEAIQRLDVVDRVLVGAFSDKRLRRIKTGVGARLAISASPLLMAAILARALLWPRPQSLVAAIQVPRRFGPIPVVTRWLVGRYQRMGLQVHVWTINDEDEMEELLDMGVDAIISDEVSALRRVLERRGAKP